MQKRIWRVYTQAVVFLRRYSQDPLNKFYLLQMGAGVSNLAFSQQVHRLVASNCLMCRSKPFEAETMVDESFYPPMVAFNPIIQVFDLSELHVIR